MLLVSIKSVNSDVLIKILTMKALICVWLLTSLGVSHSASVGNQNVKEKDVAVLEDTDVSKNSSSNGPSNSDCDFENGDFCNWTHGDAWFVQDGRQAMVTGRGPTADHTKWDASGRYAYFNPVNSTAFRLTSDIIDVGSSGNCFVFWYYVHSPKPVQLELYLEQYGVTQGPFWRMTTSSTQWRKAFYTLHQPAYTTLMFLPSKDDPNVGEIALDDLSVHQEGCSKQKTCNHEDAKCAYGSLCEVVDGEYICTCKEGLAGDRCQTIVDCREGGKYERCSGSGGKCDFIEGKAVCVCEGRKEFDVTTQMCRETCNNDERCSFGAKCELRHEHSFCTCPAGLTGDLCEIITDCQPGGKFEKCTQGRGSCEFYARKAFCECGLGKEFDVSTGQCRECDCGEGDCHFDENGTKTCECWHRFGEKNGRCESCDCGGLGQLDCHFDENGKKICTCFANYGLNDGYCTSCNCSSVFLVGCEFINGQKKCDCLDFRAQKKGECEDCDCGIGETCSFEKNSKRCHCREGFLEVDGYCEEVNSTTGVEGSSTEGTIGTTIINPDCDCGLKSYKCIRGIDGDTKCICYTGYAQANGKCSECNCGKNSKLCYFDRSSKKACICSDGYAQRNGTCAGICLSNSDCRNGGVCKVSEGGSPFCACRRPYAGEWCEAHSACAGLNCEAAGAECRVRGDRAQCECPAWSWYNADFKRCEGYSKLWIVSVALFSLSALQMIFFTCYCCVWRRKEKK